MLQRWMLRNNIDPGKVVFIGADTDGFKHKLNKLMSVSWKTPTTRSRVVYVQGADPSKVFTYVNLDSNTYNESALSQDDARDALITALGPALDDGTIFVSYAVKTFQVPWLVEILPDLREANWFDVVSWVRLLESQGDLVDLPVEYTTMKQLYNAVEDATALVSKTSFQDILQRYVPERNQVTEIMLPSMCLKPALIQTVYERLLV